jgi:hypothetical protein
MSEIVCSLCWLTIADAEKHAYEEHGWNPPQEVVERIQRQAAKHDELIDSVSAIEMVGTIADNRSGK